jgi:hypothetical protein
LGRTRQNLRLPGAVRTAGAGAQFQGGASWGLHPIAKSQPKSYRASSNSKAG